ncbi:hypothetical protein [Luteibacter yeojuensis]|uniref:Peptidase S74 domain-containing protein n=1 Tax=Luteibacter yeojuensis TaxID=345309 RepID=A0A7X5TNZ8_9GAMM|nr:hypothetical protein [Luteibacter yeojuensis]NID14971.1 hypothetical protein [Luteibacter yeojuensis]
MAIADERLMSNLREMTDCLPCVKALKPLRVFDKTTGRETIAIGAAASQACIPELISSGADGFQRLDYELLTVRLIGAVKTLADQVEALQAQVQGGGGTA